MNIQRTLSILFLIFAFSHFSVTAQAENNPLEELAWQVGPTDARIGDSATLSVPDGYVFLDAVDTKKLMEMMENIPTGKEYVFAPVDLSWYAVFEFNPVGYVKDNESLDADSLLDSVRRGTEQSNIERKQRGWGTLSILGWKFQPRYDSNTRLLEWAFLAKSDQDNSQIINYNTRILGRTGVMEVVLVADPEILDNSVSAFKSAIGGYSFISGERYADYKQGDRVAEFGLAALIAGGAAAVATKKGFWAVIAAFLASAWKLIAAAIIGLIAWFASLFKSKS